MIKEIRTIEDVAVFIKLLVSEGVDAHPDEDFNNYINIASGRSTYTTKEATFRNSLMKDCFTICEQNAVDIYDMTQEIFLKEIGLDREIPLPSSVA